MNSKDRLWSLGSGLVAVAVGIGTWFGIVSPELSTASSAREDLAGVEDLNAVHELRIAALEQDMLRLDELRAERDALTSGIPGSGRYSDFLRDIDEMAAASSAVIVRVESPEAIAYQPPVVEATATEPAPEAEDAGSDADAGEGVPSAAGSAAVIGGEGTGQPAAAPGEGSTPDSGLVPLTDPRIGPGNLAAMPITIDVAGDITALEDFLARLQSGERIVTITTAKITAPDAAAQAAPPQEGSPAVTGSAQIVGFVYVLHRGELWAP